MGESGATSTRLGWGLYQTAFAAQGGRRGDGAYHPGIEVIDRSRFGSGMEAPGRQIEIRVLFLTDGFRRPTSWR